MKEEDNATGIRLSLPSREAYRRRTQKEEKRTGERTKKEPQRRRYREEEDPQQVPLVPAEKREREEETSMIHCRPLFRTDMKTTQLGTSRDVEREKERPTIECRRSPLKKKKKICILPNCWEGSLGKSTRREERRGAE